MSMSFEPVETKHLSKLNKSFSPEGVQFRQVLLYACTVCVTMIFNMLSVLVSIMEVIVGIGRQ